ncbi:PREDICTED: uncharacterized protein LOC106725422 [Myotis brandtii]|uniref:uncharacterized protein LOC106725422 n=1 Tax=Myotis brandtii TaxID=109478 RepID=UPI000703FE00|nr:PREDICTED: uncharacterized protein LOC106725422 [Myotis brandtii]
MNGREVSTHRLLAALVLISASKAASSAGILSGRRCQLGEGLRQPGVFRQLSVRLRVGGAGFGRRSAPSHQHSLLPGAGSEGGWGGAVRDARRDPYSPRASVGHPLNCRDRNPEEIRHRVGRVPRRRGVTPARLSWLVLPALRALLWLPRRSAPPAEKELIGQQRRSPKGRREIAVVVILFPSSLFSPAEVSAGRRRSFSRAGLCAFAPRAAARLADCLGPGTAIPPGPPPGPLPKGAHSHGGRRAGREDPFHLSDAGARPHPPAFGLRGVFGHLQHAQEVPGENLEGPGQPLEWCLAQVSRSEHLFHWPSSPYTTGVMTAGMSSAKLPEK